MHRKRRYFLPAALLAGGLAYLLGDASLHDEPVSSPPISPTHLTTTNLSRNESRGSESEQEITPEILATTETPPEREELETIPAPVRESELETAPSPTRSAEERNSMNAVENNGEDVYSFGYDPAGDRNSQLMAFACLSLYEHGRITPEIISELQHIVREERHPGWIRYTASELIGSWEHFGDFSATRDYEWAQALSIEIHSGMDWNLGAVWANRQGALEALSLTPPDEITPEMIEDLEEIAEKEFVPHLVDLANSMLRGYAAFGNFYDSDPSPTTQEIVLYTPLEDSREDIWHGRYFQLVNRVRSFPQSFDEETRQEYVSYFQEIALTEDNENIREVAEGAAQRLGMGRDLSDLQRMLDPNNVYIPRGETQPYSPPRALDCPP
ncbi:hypothetical protein HYS49_02140 [Candidatus Woesearchaeota archaeon]|nr:hypothetical protein [Candidatus Woesearchaeota archaeon]